MEIQHLLIPFSHWFHLKIWLITHTVINVFELYLRNELIELLLEVMRLEVREERSIVVSSLNEGVSCVSICLDCSDYNGAMFVCQSLRLLDSLSASADCLIVDACSIINQESNILGSISVSVEFASETIVSRIQWRNKNIYDLYNRVLKH